MMVEGTLPKEGAANQKDQHMELSDLVNSELSFELLPEGRKEGRECGLCAVRPFDSSPNYFLSNEERELLGLVCMNFICFSTSQHYVLWLGIGNSVSAGPVPESHHLVLHSGGA